MDQNKSEIELLQLIIKEMADELVKLNQKIQELIAANNLLRSELRAFQEKQENKTVAVPPFDTKPFRQILDDAIQRIRLLVAEKLNKDKLTKLEIFLQSDAKKWIVILALGFTFLTYLYWYLTRS